MKFYHRHSDVRHVVNHGFEGQVSATKQSFVKECDLNNILAKYNATSKLPDMIARNPVYGNFMSPNTFMESMAAIELAREQFEALPAKVRASFGNDPSAFFEYATDARNLPQMVKWGLAEARPPSQPEALSEGDSSSQKGKKVKAASPPSLTALKSFKK